MAKNLNLETFFWNADRELLEKFFAHFDVTDGIDWNEVKRPKYLEQVFSAFENAERRNEMETVLDDIHEMSIKADTPEILITNLTSASGKQIDERIVKEGTLQDIAMWVYLNVDKAARESIERYLEVAKLNHQMLFSVVLKKGDAVEGWSFSEAQVEEVIRQYLVTNEHRGRTVKLVTVSRPNAHYHFVYFEDFHRNRPMCKNGKIEEGVDNGADEMLFIHDKTNDRLYARLHLNQTSRKKKLALCDIFTRAAMNRSVDMQDDGKTPYDLENVCKPGFSFDLSNLPEFEYVKFKELGCISNSLGGDKVILQAADGDIHERLQRNTEKYDIFKTPDKILYIVLEAKLNSTFNAKKPIKIRVSQDKISHFKDPDIQIAVEKALQEWKIAEKPESADAPVLNKEVAVNAVCALKVAE